MKTLLLITLVLVACNHLKEGDVIEKRYEPDRTYMMLVPIITGKTTILVPYWVYDNEDYVITIQGVYKGKERTETVYISESQYNCLSYGDHFMISEDCSLEDNNNTKTRK